MFYDFDTHVIDAFRFEVYGRLIPLNAVGAYFLALSVLPLIALYFLQRRIDERRTHALIVGTAAVSLLGTYIGSCRWLDDLSVNLVHPYNLLHHGRFSVSPTHMVNGTVELVYYLLLTPFAQTQASLFIADYVLGFLIAVLHLILLGKILRPFDVLPRLIALMGFSVIFPLIQNFSGGYGNALISLLVFWGIYNLFLNRIGWTYLCAAILPALRPDAILYTAALVLADLLMYRKIRGRYWLLMPIPAVVYLVAVKLMYGFYIPTPMLLKQVTLSDLIHVMPQMPSALWTYLVGNRFNPTLLIGAVLFFILRRRTVLTFSKPACAIFLGTMFPVLFFFLASGNFGYNPTLSRYYVGWELALTITGLLGFATVLEVLRDYWRRRWPGMPTQLPALWTVLIAAGMVGLALIAHLSLSTDNDGKALGLELSTYDLKRLRTLIYASRYVDSVLPRDWHIASTEMDTFGFFNGREIEDLWGFSNRRIAGSTRVATGWKTIKIRPSELMDSNVEVFWVRTVDTSTPINEVSLFRVDDPRVILPAYFNIPNISQRINQTGNPFLTLSKYSVVRIFHDKEFVTMLLVRNDLMPQLLNQFDANGHTLRTSGELDMDALKKACIDWPE